MWCGINHNYTWSYLIIYIFTKPNVLFKRQTNKTMRVCLFHIQRQKKQHCMQTNNVDLPQCWVERKLFWRVLLHRSLRCSTLQTTSWCLYDREGQTESYSSHCCSLLSGCPSLLSEQPHTLYSNKQTKKRHNTNKYMTSVNTYITGMAKNID